MNKHLTSLLSLTALLLILSGKAYAQIPNPGFEQWETITFMGKTFNSIEGWNTSNLMSVFNSEPEMVTKTTDAYEGNYAVVFSNTPNKNNMSAMASTGTSALLDQPSEKFPVNGKVTALKGFFKYDFTAASDSCSIFVMLYKDSNTIGYGEFVTGNKVNAFTAFTATIDYYEDKVPDSASIYIYATRDNFREGSVLVVDALSLETPNTGLFDGELKSIKATVYPNPATGTSTIEFEQLSNGRTQVLVYDILGNIVADPSHNQLFGTGTNQVRWDTTPLSPGIYLVRIKQQDAEKTIRVTVK
jgi:hypothetical protein